MSNVEKTAQALGLEFGILTESAALERRLTARSELQGKLAASREKHLKIAAKLAMGGPEAAALKVGALKMVKLWREKQLCSPVYIDRWQQILDAKPQQVAQSLLAMDDDECGRALRQNTPFSVED
jgi:hypothetical protein